MSKNHSSPLPQVRRGTRVLSRGKNAWDDSSRLIALLIAPHLPFHPTKEASSPPVSMATSRKRATGRYHFHRRGKGECGSHHLPRFSRGFLAPTGARKNAPREKKSGHAFGIILEIQVRIVLAHILNERIGRDGFVQALKYLS